MIFVKFVIVTGCVILHRWCGSRADDVQEFIKLDKTVLVCIKFRNDILAVFIRHITNIVVVHEFHNFTGFHMAVFVDLDVIPKLLRIELSNLGKFQPQPLNLYLVEK